MYTTKPHRSIAPRFRSWLVIAAIFCPTIGASTATAQTRYRCLAPAASDSFVVNSAVELVTDTIWQDLRAKYGIPSGSADISVVQDDSICAKAMTGMEESTNKAYASSFVAVRLGAAAPFYLISRRGDWWPSTGYLLSPQFKLVAGIGTEDWIGPPPARPVVTAPADFQTTAMSSHRVAFAWTSSSNVSTFRLQRAAGEGLFDDIGSALSGAVRAAVDSTVVGGVSYRYRVVAYGSDPDGWISNVITVTPQDSGTATRVGVGLVYRDQFDRPDGDLGSNWETAAGSPFHIVGGVARPPAAPTGFDVARVTDSAMTPRASMCFQTQMTSLTRLGSPMMWTQLTSGPATLSSGWVAFMGGEAGNAVLLYSVVNGNGQLVAITPGGLFEQNVPQSFKICTGPGSQRIWLGNQLVVNLASTVLDGVAGTVGLRDGGTSADQGSWDDAIVTTSNTITVTGLPVGYKLRVGTLTSDAATASGSVTFDVQGAKFPIAQIDVLDASGNAVTQISPTGGVWGGDQYTFTRS